MGLTQQELARRLEGHRALISKLEAAKLNVSLATLDQIRAQLLITVPAPEPYQVSIGRLVQEARKGRYSQERLSEIAGFSVLFVGRLERGIANTSIDQIEALAEALGIDPEYFLAC